MLILVAVTVRTVIQSSLFGHAGKATSSYSMHEAREQLGTTLAGAQAEKYTNKDYDENDYLNKYITDHLPDSKVEGDIAIVDGWGFELDRSVPKIGQDLGKEGTFTYPDLKLEKGILADDKLSIPIIITAQEAENGISKIELILNGTVIKTFDDCNNSTEEITRTYTATENGTYKVRVYSKINRTGYIKIEEIPEPTPQIGDIVRYTPEQAENYLMEGKYSGSSDQSIPQDTGLKWKVLSKNSDDTIDLIADRPITTTVTFTGALGYNNGVYLLNDLCKSHYSNTNLGAVSRSINLEDIESKMSQAGIYARNSYSSYSTRYGETFTCTDNYPHFVPDVYKLTDETTVLESSNCYSTPTINTYSQENSLIVKQTYYYVTQQAEFYKDPNFYSLIFDTSQTYWLASRSVNRNVDSANFNLRVVENSIISGYDQFISFMILPSSYAYLVRPVVQIPAKYKLQQISGTNEWEIVEK